MNLVRPLVAPAVKTYDPGCKADGPCACEMMPDRKRRIGGQFLEASRTYAKKPATA
jgi:hypothetical protein